MGQGDVREEGGRGTALAVDPVDALVARLEPQVGELACRMVRRYREEIVDYRLRLEHDEVLSGDVEEVTADSVRTLLRNLRGGTESTEEEFARTAASATLRVHQGISLEAFLHAVRLWGQMFWQTVLDTARADDAAEREAALAMSAQVLRHMDLMSIAATRAYVHEVQGVWSAREIVRRDLLDGIIAGEGDSAAIRRIARSLGLSLGDAYAVVLARGGERTLHETLEPPIAARGPLRRVVEATRQHLRPAAGCVLVGMRRGEVVALYPVESDAELAVVREQCDALARALSVEGVSVGLSGVRSPLASVPVGYSEATEALDIAAAAGVLGRAVVFDDVLIDHIARSSPHSDRILEGTLRPLLRYDAEREAGLVATLRAYVEAGFNLSRSAETLCVHPNTVQYRLRRIKELSGRNPFDPEDLLLLYLGLKLAELRPAAG